jgi:hypothetical protein
MTHVESRVSGAAGQLGEQLDGAAQEQIDKAWPHAGRPPRWAVEEPR